MKQLSKMGWVASCALLLVSACGDDDGSVLPPLTDAGADAGEQDSEDTTDSSNDESTGDESSTDDSSGDTDTSSEESSEATGDSGTQGMTGLDAGPDAEAPDAQGPAPYAISVTVEGDMVGLPVAVQAEVEGSDIDYEWEVVSAPAESELKTEDLEEADSERARFNPDRAGTYTLKVTVSGSQGTASTLQDVVVRGFQVPYWSVSGNSEEHSVIPSMVRSDGANPRAVGCPNAQAAAGEEAWLNELQSAQLSMAPHMPGPGEKSRWAWAHQVESGWELNFGDGQTDCDENLPVTAPFETLGVVRLAFSMDGSRLAYTAAVGDPATLTVITTGIDGSDVRTVRPEGEPGSSGLVGVPVSWSDDGRLVWTEQMDSESVVYAADDVEGASEDDDRVSVLLDCREAATPITQVREAYLRGGQLIVASVQSTAGAVRRTIWLIGADEEGSRSCEADADTNQALTDDNAFDLDVTPDGSHILYYARQGSMFETHLYIAPTDGSSAPLLLAGDDGVANTGAHFAAGGRQIVWSKTAFESYPPDAGEGTYDRPTSSEVWIVNADGSGARKLVGTLSTPAAANVLSTGATGGTCSMSTGGAGGVGLSGLLLGLTALLLRRRRQ